jgi:hypothetical protein
MASLMSADSVPDCAPHQVLALKAEFEASRSTEHALREKVSALHKQCAHVRETIRVRSIQREAEEQRQQACHEELTKLARASERQQV